MSNEMMVIVLVVFAVLNVLWIVAYWHLVNEFTSHLSAQHDLHRKERQDLLDRLQSKDLKEYKAMTRDPAPAPAPKAERPEVIPL